MGAAEERLNSWDVDAARGYDAPSCGAAISTKPKARLCEPWVTGHPQARSRGAAIDLLPKIFLFEFYSMTLQ
jgi:hypothetical protein